MSSSQQPPRPVQPSASKPATVAYTVNPMRPSVSQMSAPAPAASVQAAAPKPIQSVPAASVQVAAPKPVQSAPPAASVQAASQVALVRKPTGPSAPVAAPAGSFLIDDIPYRKFSQKTIESACNIALTKDKAIKLDYWVPSLDKKAIIALTKTGDRHLYISRNDFTTKFEKCYNVSGTEECIIETANSIYIVAKNMAVKNVDISQADLMGDDDDE